MRVTVRAYAELCDFLPPSRRQTDFTLDLRDSHSVKHVLESAGIPHTEIEVILVNGRSVDFSCMVRHGDRIAAYPVFESLDVSPLLRLRPEPLRETKFILDVNLGRLAPVLRLLGFDTSFPGHMEDSELAREAVQQQRILLTRDRTILRRRILTHGLWIRSQDYREQAAEVLDRLDLRGSVRPFTRCVRCSGLLESVEKESILHRLEPLTRKYYNEFRMCPECGQIYWKGSHWDALNGLVESLTGTGSS
jgi:uncharacterized protein with PIN domain